MISTHVLAPQLRMPTAFGPAPGPRNIPDGVELPPGLERICNISFTAPADASELQLLVPERCTLLDARLTVQVTRMANLRWFAGHGYNIISVAIPVRYEDEQQRIDGQFVPVMWESMADPILTGRDELGFPKIFADIDVHDWAAGAAESVVVRASWEGTTFFEAAVSDLAPAGAPEPSLPVITRRYIPAVGALNTSDADYLTVSNPVSGSSISLVDSVSGSGRFEFTPVTWRQIPFQFPIINALCALQVDGPATVRATIAEGIFGMAANRRI